MSKYKIFNNMLLTKYSASVSDYSSDVNVRVKNVRYILVWTFYFVCTLKDKNEEPLKIWNFNDHSFLNHN